MRIKNLEERRSKLILENQQKNKDLEVRKQQIKRYQEEEENPIIKQIREHFKALREELRNMAYEDEEDLDIDSMSYEVGIGIFSNCWSSRRR